MLEFAGQTALALVAGGALLLSYRRIRRSAPLAAHLFTIGLLARLAIGLGLAMSWLAAGTPNGIDGPDPRWFPDAQMYYVAAVDAAANGLGRVEDTEASPVFVRTLALWMRFTGDTHAGAHLLNVLVFAGLCVGICVVATRRGDRRGQQVAALVIGAFALSPNLIILASQPLKDTLFFGALACVAISLEELLSDDPVRPVRLRAVPLAGILLGVYVMSGMRAYFGLMILGLLGAVLAFRALMLTSRRAVPWPYLARAAVLLAVVWLGCRIGGGPYYSLFVDPFLAPVTVRLDAAVSRVREAAGFGAGTASTTPAVPDGGLLSVVERSRRGFETSGGATNMAPPELDRSTRTGVMSRLAGALLGLGAVFVPVSLLRATGLVTFEGGGRFLLLTAVDTLYLDGAVAWCLVFVWRRRTAITGGWTLAAVLLLLGTVGAVLVGYVVTNYGTLFRLRLLAVVPFWLLPLVVADRSTFGPTDVAAGGGTQDSRECHRPA